ncbi:hypothetical protein NDU88_000635 [Pleurodeles waltl]|uniref:Uncharacterized protein n=1 Tax=Pleurodeles waltl TaxID=8319 RepID=A0AAV7MI87_PLEWA|nr:hypothetical protein NDU88_000635 [Pleurodeles waltl]
MGEEMSHGGKWSETIVPTPAKAREQQILALAAETHIREKEDCRAAADSDETRSVVETCPSLSSKALAIIPIVTSQTADDTV